MSHYSHQPVKSGFKTLRRQARGRLSDEIMFGRAEAGPPALGIFNVPLLTCSRARSSDGDFINSATGVNILQEELNKDVFLW